MKIRLAAIFLASLAGLGQPIVAAEAPAAIEVAVPGYPWLPSGVREDGEVRVNVEIGPDGRVASAKAAGGPNGLRSWLAVISDPPVEGSKGKPKPPPR